MAVPNKPPDDLADVARRAASGGTAAPGAPAAPPIESLLAGVDSEEVRNAISGWAGDYDKGVADGTITAAPWDSFTDWIAQLHNQRSTQNLASEIFALVNDPQHPLMRNVQDYAPPAALTTGDAMAPSAPRPSAPASTPTAAGSRPPGGNKQRWNTVLPSGKYMRDIAWAVAFQDGGWANVDASDVKVLVDNPNALKALQAAMNKVRMADTTPVRVENGTIVGGDRKPSVHVSAAQERDLNQAAREYFAWEGQRDAAKELGLPAVKPPDETTIALYQKWRDTTPEARSKNVRKTHYQRGRASVTGEADASGSVPPTDTVNDNLNAAAEAGAANKVGTPDDPPTTTASTPNEGGAGGNGSGSGTASTTTASASRSPWASGRAAAATAPAAGTANPPPPPPPPPAPPAPPAPPNGGGAGAPPPTNPWGSNRAPNGSGAASTPNVNQWASNRAPNGSGSANYPTDPGGASAIRFLRSRWPLLMLLGATGYDAVRNAMYPEDDAGGPGEPPPAPVPPPPPPRMPADSGVEAMPGEDPRNLMYRRAGRAAAERLPFQYEGQPYHPGSMPGRYH